MVGAPKKMSEDTVGFSYRTKASSWRLFTAIATLKGEMPTEIFRAREKSYIEENSHLLQSAIYDLEKMYKNQ